MNRTAKTSIVIATIASLALLAYSSGAGPISVPIVATAAISPQQTGVLSWLDGCDVSVVPAANIDQVEFKVSYEKSGSEELILTLNGNKANNDPMPVTLSQSVLVNNWTKGVTIKPTGNDVVLKLKGYKGTATTKIEAEIGTWTQRVTSSSATGPQEPLIRVEPVDSTNATLVVLYKGILSRINLKIST